MTRVSVPARRRSFLVVFSLLVAGSVSVGLPVTGSAAVVEVPADQPTIQAGIDAALPGDTVRVAPGTYSGEGNRNIGFGGKEIVLLGEGGASVTVIDGNSEDAHGFRIEGGETAALVIDGFTIRHFFPTYGDDRSDGGGMLILSATPTVRACVITENAPQAGNGGGIYAEGGTFESCLIAGNVAGGQDVPGFGGGIYAAGCTLVDCRIEGNAAADWYAGDLDGVGGGVVLNNSTMEGCTVVGNFATYSAGVEAAGALDDMYIVRCTIANNYAGSSSGPGGLGVHSGGAPRSFIVQQTIIWGNGYCGVPEVALGSAQLQVDFICSLLDSSGVAGDGEAVYGPHCVFEDPLFCDSRGCDDAPYGANNYNLTSDSPARAENSPCHALIGASGDLCEPSAVPNPLFAGAAILGLPAPNPAAAAVHCSLTLPRDARVAAGIFDVSGRLVRSILAGDIRAGARTLAWDLKDSQGNPVPGGIYFLRARAGERTETRTVVVAR